MAFHALRPAASPANTSRARFNLALARYTNATMGRDTLCCPSSIKAALAPQGAVDLTTAQRLQPDLATFATRP